MITHYAGAAVGLSGGVICGLSLLGVLLAGKAHLLRIGVSLGLLLGTVFLACAVAWTRFNEYVGQNGWWWLAGGVVVGSAWASLSSEPGQPDEPTPISPRLVRHLGRCSSRSPSSPRWRPWSPRS